LSRPFITLKLATSLDGKIALSNGQSEWITGEKSRAEGRKLRASHDAIAIGANTAVLDNPQLTSRISGASDPVRIIFDSSLRLSPHSNLALTAKDIPVWIFSAVKSGDSYNALTQSGCRILPVPVKAETGLDVGTALDIMKRQGISRLLLEGGGTLTASFLIGGYIDHIAWFRAPIILGGDGRSGIGDLGLETLDMAAQFKREEVRELGHDLYESYERIS